MITNQKNCSRLKRAKFTIRGSKEPCENNHKNNATSDRIIKTAKPKKLRTLLATPARVLSIICLQIRCERLYRNLASGISAGTQGYHKAPSPVKGGPWAH